MLRPKRRGALLPLAERKPRLIKIALLPRATGVAARQAMVQKLRLVRKRAYTLTFDNGRIVAEHKAIA